MSPKTMSQPLPRASLVNAPAMWTTPAMSAQHPHSTVNATAVTSGQTIAMTPKTMATIPRTRSITQLRSSQFFSTG